MHKITRRCIPRFISASPIPTTRRLSLLILLSVLLISSRSGAATSEQVETALQKAKAFLYSEQKNGTWEAGPVRDKSAKVWEAPGGQFSGTTALAVYALLAAGEDPNDPKIAPAIAFLKKTEPMGVYAIGLRCQVWLLLPKSPETRRLATQEYERLQKAVFHKGDAKDLFGYVSPAIDWTVDHSVSQYGVLGVWACSEMGVEVPSDFWTKTEDRWIHDQLPDGGWRYSNQNFDKWHTEASAPAMTAAAVATLFITQDYTRQREGIVCKGNPQNAAIEAGLKWMADHHDQWSPHGDIEWQAGWLPNYTMYGVERIGVASGLKYIGDTDWYAWGAEKLVTTQDATGAWGESDGKWGAEHNVNNTAYAMLFLARGRAPVIINKLQYSLAEGKDAGKPGRWNQRPRDIANLVRWIGNQAEHNYNWQVVDLNHPVEELHDAPVLYLSGSDALSFTTDEMNKLRLFAQQGGLIIGNADCAAAQSAFADSFEKLGRTLFPHYEFRVLPPDHCLFTEEQYPAKRWKQKPTVMSLGNGIRELMMLVPGDGARFWQLGEFHGDDREESAQLAADIFQYATDEKTPRVKGASYLISPNPAITAERAIKMGRLKFAGNWDPEPAGWLRLGASLHNNQKIDLSIKSVELGKDSLEGLSLLSLTGTGAFSFRPDQRSALQKFLADGGILVIDAGGGDSSFAQSAEQLCTQLDPTASTAIHTPLPIGDPIYQATGIKPSEIHYRQFARKMLGEKTGSLVSAVTINGHPAIYFSREDLSTGSVGQETNGIIGYEPGAALRIMTGIVMQAKSR